MEVRVWYKGGKTWREDDQNSFPENFVFRELLMTSLHYSHWLYYLLELSHPSWNTLYMTQHFEHLQDHQHLLAKQRNKFFSLLFSSSMHRNFNVSPAEEWIYYYTSIQWRTLKEFDLFIISRKTKKTWCEKVMSQNKMVQYIPCCKKKLACVMFTKVCLKYFKEFF